MSDTLVREHPMNGNYDAHGTTFKVEVSPCSWMYPGYGFQFGFKDTNGMSWGYLGRKSITEKEATKDDVRDMLETMIWPITCTTCSGPGFTYKGNNRGTECEKCFTTKLKAEFDEAQKDIDKEVTRQDRLHRTKGCTHRISAWVHPKGGGDDFQVDYYSVGAPTPASIKKLLRNEGSAVLDDYTVTDIWEGTK